MANLGSVVVQFLAENKMGQTLGNIKDDLKGVGDESGKTKRSFGKLSAAWATSIPIAGAVVAGVAGMANFLIDAGKAALEDKNSQDKLAHTLRNVKGVTDEAIDANEDWITSMQLATLVADTDLRDAVGKLTLATGDLAEAQDLTTIAVDAAAGSGKSLTSITDALAKAANGNTGALEKQFPWLDKNKDGTVTLTEATKGLEDAYKGAAGEATKTRPWEVLATIWDELKESLGTYLVPIMEKFSDWFKSEKNRQKIQDFIDKVADLSYEVGTTLVDAFTAIYNWFKDPKNQAKIRLWLGYFQAMGRFIGDVIGFIGRLITAMSRIPNPGNIGGGGNTGWVPWSVTPPPAAATPAVGQHATTPAYQPTVIVTEEQVYRAIQRLIMRGDARNGRLVVAR